MISPGSASRTETLTEPWIETWIETRTALRRLVPVLACALLLAGCRFGSPVSLLDDEEAVSKALSGIQSRYSGAVPMLKIAINDTEMVVQARNPSYARELSEWRLVREQYLFLNYDRVYGPNAVVTAGIGRDFEGQLFNLKDVNFAAWGKIADAAVARAALKDKGGVSSIELSRPSLAVPSKSGGPAQWTIEVKSVRESVRVFANADGEIVRARVASPPGTPVNMYQRPDLAEEAAADVRQRVGTSAILTKVSFSSAAIGFTTTLKDDNYPIKFARDSNIRANAAYNWTPEGLQGGAGSINISSHFSNPDAPFAVDDVDWALLPKIVADARTALALPNGRIAAIDIHKPTDGVGIPAPIWKIEIEENKERGTYIADTKGAAKNVLVPPSRRQPARWLDPGTVADTLGRIAQEFGPAAKFESIMFYDSHVNIVAQDPRKPGDLTQVHLRDDGFKRFGSVMFPGRREHDFTLSELRLTKEKLAAVIERTLAEMKMPAGSLTRVTVGRNNVENSRRGGATIEVRAEARGAGSGWAVFELDGSVVRIMRP